MRKWGNVGWGSTVVWGVVTTGGGATVVVVMVVSVVVEVGVTGAGQATGDGAWTTCDPPLPAPPVPDDHTARPAS